VTSWIDIATLLIAIVALVVALFPLRSWVVSKYWPYKVNFEEMPRVGLARSQYRFYVTIQNRTNRSAYFGLGYDNIEYTPTPNYPDIDVTRFVNGERSPANTGVFPVRPNEREMWIIFLGFERPLTRPAGVSFFNRVPEPPVPRPGGERRRQFRYELRPING